MTAEDTIFTNMTAEDYKFFFYLREELAALAHDQWSGWLNYQFQKSVENPDGSVTISPENVKRWKRQSTTEYENLPRKEQESDCIEADRVLKIMYQRILDQRASTTEPHILPLDSGGGGAVLEYFSDTSLVPSPFHVNVERW